VISDGFGDEPVHQDLRLLEIVEEYLRGHERLVRLKVADRLRGSDAATDVYADLCNEARITAWKVLAKRPDAPPEYVSAAMSMRVSECLHRGTWTGMETHRGRPTDPLRRPMHQRASVSDETLRLDEILSSGSSLEEIMMRYHDGDIVRALNEELTLSQRTHVVLRFWGGWSNSEIAAHQECSKQTVERQWRTEIRPRLVRRLGFLETPDVPA
jgi:hypothetical protein